MRNLKRSDLPHLHRILCTTGAFHEEEIKVAMELFHAVLDDPMQKDYLVAIEEEDGQISGYILYGPVPLADRVYDIYWLAVKPDSQGKGVGRRLIAHVEENIKDLGIRMICLETSSKDSYERTRRFYQQAGYVEESRIRDFYYDGDDRITYVKRFHPSEEKN
jgi:ribosomal protein S18 acetylase RimI-like enzyme